MPNPDLMVAFAAIVVAAARMPAETIESLPAEFVSVVTASEPTEKETVEAFEVVAEQEQDVAVDLVRWTWNEMSS